LTINEHHQEVSQHHFNEHAIFTDHAYSTAKHSTFVAPQDAGYADLAHHTEMQTETADFLADDSLGTVSNINAVLK
ncbi:hypothetical protein, partial [Vibrio paracholerae]|uniref:hypothetical protein n=1 Tax=Vibrio paracholerae TaxID=650003 RepID=UPI00049727B7